MITGSCSCRRTDQNNPPVGWHFAKIDKQGFGLFYPDGQDHQPITNYAKRKVEQARENRKKKFKAPAEYKAAAGSTAFDRIRESMRPMTPAERTRIASTLCLPLGIFDLLGVMYVDIDDFNHPAWVFPERNERGDVIGYTLRYADGSKRNQGNRGLSLAADWDKVQPGGPIYMCEGASDTLALFAMGLNAVGRPSATGGVELLIKLLRGLDLRRPLVVLGENDRKANGTWPGREGAERTARQLAKELGRPVSVALPPLGVKDARELIDMHSAEIRAKKKKLSDLGRELAEHVRESAEVIPSLPPGEAEVTVANFGAATPQFDFTAAELLPPEDMIGPAPECPTCDGPRQVLMRNDGRKLNRLCFFDCRKLSCSGCGTKKRAQWRATVQAHLEDLGPDAKVWLWWCADGKDWNTASRLLRAARAEHVKIEVEPERSMIVSTIRPTATAASGAMEISTVEAISRMCAAIDALPAIRKSAFTSSRGWKLVGNERPGNWQGWRKVSAIASSAKALDEVLRFHKVEYTVKEHGTAAGWTWRAWQWKDSDCRESGGRGRVEGDLIFGEVLPDVDWEDDGDEADVGGTGPPSGVWVDW